jgi:hypothetical protein
MKPTTRLLQRRRAHFLHALRELDDAWNLNENRGAGTNRI